MRSDDLQDEQRGEIEAMMQGPAGTLLMLVLDRSRDLDDGIRFDRESMAWDEYLALRALRAEIEKIRTERQNAQHE